MTAGALDEKKIVLVMLVFFLLLRVGVVITIGQEPHRFGDARGYHDYARAILKDGSWLTAPHFPGAERPPVYPLFIALVYAIFGTDHFLAVYIFQAVIGAWTCLYIYRFSREIFADDFRVALLALAWSGFYVFYLKYAGELIRETLVFFLLLVFFFYLFLYLKGEKKQKRDFWLSVLAYFLLIHLDPRYLFYLPFLAVPFVLYNPFWPGMKRYGVFLLTVVLTMVPWTVRNLAAYEGFVLVNTRTLDLRDADRHRRDPVMGNRMKYNVLNFGTIREVTMNEDYPGEQEREAIKRGENPRGRSAEEVTAIRDDVYPAASFPARKWYQFLHLWKPFDFGLSYRPFPDARFDGAWSFKHNLSSILGYGCLLPFVFLGIYRLVKRGDRAGYFLALPLVVQTLLHVLQWGKVRYRVPVDAFLIILGTYGLYTTAGRISAKIKAKD